MAEAPTMPSDIPNPKADSYGLQTVNPLQSTQFGSGRVRVRENWRNVPQRVTLTYRLSDYQMQLFEGFLKHECRNGAAKFTQPLRMPRSTECKNYYVQLEEIYSGPTWVDGTHNLNGFWEVSYTAITIEDTRTTEAEYYALLLGMSVPEAIEYLNSGLGGINTYWLAPVASPNNKTLVINTNSYIVRPINVNP